MAKPLVDPALYTMLRKPMPNRYLIGIAFGVVQSLYAHQQNSKRSPSLPSSASLLMATFAFSMVQIATDSPLKVKRAIHCR